MSIDLAFLGKKIRVCRETYNLSHDDLFARTGIPVPRLVRLEGGLDAPSGDEILILSDLFLVEFKFFLSSDVEPTFKRVQKLFRMLGDWISPADRWAISEFVFLCEGEAFLESTLGRRRNPLPFIPMRGDYWKGHGIDAARVVRGHLGLSPDRVLTDPYASLRQFQVHLFRRRLSNSKLSGLCIRHPEIGPCVLVNYDEDLYRQRFTVAHEFGHALLDTDQTLVISKSEWKSGDLSEVRANAFAANFLCPPETLRALPQPKVWNEERVRDVASRLGINTTPLLIALENADLIDRAMFDRLRRARVEQARKSDPELGGLAGASLDRKRLLLSTGLSDYYVKLAFEAYDHSLISRGRLAQLLRMQVTDLEDIESIYARKSS